MTTTFDEEMRAALAAGQPNLDNVSDGTVDGPDICRDACPLAGTEHTEDQCAPEVGDRRCPTCRGAGGWQQHDGAIEECPRGCMTEDGPDPDVCADCDHQRAFHAPCLGLDCTCGEFIEPTQNGAAA